MLVYIFTNFFLTLLCVYFSSYYFCVHTIVLCKIYYENCTYFYTKCLLKYY